MAGESIITPGYEETNPTPEQDVVLGEKYLIAKNYLSEFSKEELPIVRSHLGVLSVDEIDKKLSNITEGKDDGISAVNDHLAADDPHGIKDWTKQELVKYVKTDGSTKFTSPQFGVDPKRNEHLATLGSVKTLLAQYKQEANVEGIIPEVEKKLKETLENSERIARNLDYNLKEEINSKLSKVVLSNGTVAFHKPQVGVYPTSDAHLSTKQYVDDKVREHISKTVDPHGYLAILNQRLQKYAKVEDVLDRRDTYSRTEIDNAISTLVDQYIELSIAEYKAATDNRFNFIRDQKYVKQDGSVAFDNPQSGVRATEDSHLVPLVQVNEIVSKIYKELSDKIKNESCVWVTSGPVETTVGFLEDNSRVPEKMSIQEVLDSIFYGKKVSVTSPETGNVGEVVDVTVCITGDLSTVDIAYLYQNDELIRTIQREEFEANGCVTIQSNAIEEDTEFRLDVYYSNDAKHSEYSKTKLAYPIFVGILPEWYFGTNVTYDLLLQLSNEDKVNNKFYDRESHLRELSHQYNFDKKEASKLILALPSNYPDLKSIYNGVQEFANGAFDFKIITVTPFTVAGQLVDYKLYIYKQPLVRFDSKVTFKF